MRVADGVHAVRLRWGGVAFLRASEIASRGRVVATPWGDGIVEALEDAPGGGSMYKVELGSWAVAHLHPSVVRPIGGVVGRRKRVSRRQLLARRGARGSAGDGDAAGDDDDDEEDEDDDELSDADAADDGDAARRGGAAFGGGELVERLEAAAVAEGYGEEELAALEAAAAAADGADDDGADGADGDDGDDAVGGWDDDDGWF